MFLLGGGQLPKSGKSIRAKKQSPEFITDNKKEIGNSLTRNDQKEIRSERANKKSREEIAEMDDARIQRSDRLGRLSLSPNYYGDFLGIVDLKKYIKELKQAHFVHTNHCFGTVIEGKKITAEQ